MRRRLLILAAFLLAGAVVNVAVAWGCAAWTPVRPLGQRGQGAPGSRSDRQPTPSEEQWLADRGAALLARDDGAVFDHRGIGVRNRRILHLRQDQEWDWYSAGWPSRALDGLVRHYHRHPGRRGGKPANDKHEYIGLMRRPPSSGAHHALPFVPIWPGFAVNTLFYAAVLWLLIPGPFALRRFVRVTRSLCPACAYPRGVPDVCSECGKALPGA